MDCNLFTLLSLEERTDIENRAVKSVFDRVCPICHDAITIPVRLNRPYIHCEDCGDESGAVACLMCVRQWLQLNIPHNMRTPVKHLICQRMIPDRLNAAMAYTIDYKLMELLDKNHPISCVCECGISFDKRSNYHTHKTNYTCPKSIYKCRFCEFRGVSSDYIKHTTLDSVHGGCSQIDYALRLVSKQKRQYNAFQNGGDSF
jgi:hypothetical protein